MSRRRYIMCYPLYRFRHCTGNTYVRRMNGRPGGEHAAVIELSIRSAVLRAGRTADHRNVFGFSVLTRYCENPTSLHENNALLDTTRKYHINL